MRLRGGTTGIWPMKLLYDRTGMSYLASRWRRFCQWHGVVPGHLVVFNFDNDHQITVIVFDDDMCRQEYAAPACGKPAVSSSSSD
jgi:hypothetical protein